MWSTGCRAEFSPNDTVLETVTVIAEPDEDLIVVVEKRESESSKTSVLPKKNSTYITTNYMDFKQVIKVPGCQRAAYLGGLATGGGLSWSVTYAVSVGACTPNNLHGEGSISILKMAYPQPYLYG